MTIAGPRAAAAELAPPLPSRSRRPVLRSLLRDKTAMLGLAVIVALVGAAVFAPLLAPQDPNHVDVLHKFAHPSPSFPLGTDNLGRDILSRLLFGARLSIGTSVVAGLLIGLIGTVIGLIAGFAGGVVDGLIGRIVDVLLAFPPFLLAMAVLGLLGPGLVHLTFVLAAVAWAGYARIVRGAVLVEREREYVEAARASGATIVRIMAKHVLPNIIAPIVVLVTLDMGMVLLSISGLSFLGLGVEPPTAEWGAMLSDGRTYLSQAPQLMVFPGAAIFLLVMGFNLLGDGLRDALDPHTRRLARRPSRRPRGRVSRPSRPRAMPRPGGGK